MTKSHPFPHSLLTCLLAAGILIPGWVLAHQSYVTGEIQTALNRASPGDTIIVGPGEYEENLDFLGKDIVLKSRGGFEQTTIRGGAGPCVSFRNGETRSAVIEGFTLTGSSGYPAILIFRPSQLCSIMPLGYKDKCGSGILHRLTDGFWP